MKNQMTMGAVVEQRRSKMATGLVGTKKYYSKVSANGQITLPKEVREILGCEAGDVIDFVPGADGVHVYKKKSLREELDEWRESLPDHVKENIRKRAGWTVNQYHEYFDNLPENVAKRKEKYGV